MIRTYYPILLYKRQESVISLYAITCGLEQVSWIGSMNGILNITTEFNLREEMLAYLGKQLLSLMPDGYYRDFYAWALSDDCPLQAHWLTTIGIDQFVNLAIGLLSGTSRDAEVMSRIYASVSPMTAYLLFETISDNMAFGCATWYPQQDDDLRHQRHTLLSDFNRSMVERIEGRKAGRMTNYAWQDIAQQLSSLTQSLSEKKQHTVIEAFVQRFPSVSFEDVEYGAGAVLVANIEACGDVIDYLDGHPLQPILRETLRYRYDGVSRLLNDEAKTLDDLLEIGTHTILVMAVLAYYSAAIADAMAVELQPVLDDGLLTRVFENSAILIRLLNDMGTPLLKDAEARRENFALLREKHQTQNFDDVFTLIRLVADENTALTRLQKDIEFGEFNIALHHVPPLQHDIDAALDHLEERVATCAGVYATRSVQLQADMAELAQRTGTTAFGEIALRFVTFHEILYANPYNKNDGEYAV